MIKALKQTQSIRNAALLLNDQGINVAALPNIHDLFCEAVREVGLNSSEETDS